MQTPLNHSTTKQYFCLKTLILLVALFSNLKINAQNWGFEATPVASPPSNWTIVTGTWTINTASTYVRTGTQSMKIVDPATSGTTIGTTTAFNTTTSAGYIITMGWGKSNTASNALFYTGYRSGTTNTFNPTTTSTGQAANINNTTWSRVISVSASGTIAAGNYGIPIRAFRSASTAGTEVYLDDFISYGSSSNIPDVSAPSSPSLVNISGNTVSWTNGADNGAPASGIGGVVIIRANGASLTPPSLNDQAMYNPTNGAAGCSSFVDGSSNTWTVVASISGSGTSSFVDASATGGPYTYVVYMRDLAYNYSVGSAASIAVACTNPPTPGTSTASATNVCSGFPSILSLTGNSFGTGQTYQWQSSSSVGGPYTAISGVLLSPSFTVNPTTASYYRCEVICSGGTPSYSTPIQITINTGFAGTYTINSALPTGGTNFQSYTDAVAALSGPCGLGGPVVFNVAPGSGPYTEQITIPSLVGSSAVNSVTFNGNGTTLQFNSTNTAARHVIKLDGADYITFNELNIVANTGTYGWGIHFINGADYNSVSLCTITTSTTDITSSNFQPIVMSNSTSSTTTTGNNGSNNTFQDNTLIGGYYGVTLCGSGTGAENTGNTFTSNTIRDFYSYGFYMIYQKNPVVSTCDLSRLTRNASTTTAGVYMTTGTFGGLIENNRIHNYFDLMTTNTSTFYGVYCVTSGTSTDITRVINNVIYNINNAGALYGVYNSAASYENIYHNTISFDYAGATAGTTYGVYQTTSVTNVNVKNNVITIGRGGTGAKVGLYYNTTASSIASNNNVVYLNSTGSGTQNYGSSSTTGFASLSLWQTANGGVYDANSVEANPGYTSPSTGDFTPTSVAVNNAGANVGVLYDILGNSRGSNPDPGAYEFSLAGLDASINWVSPTSPTTFGPQTITVSITNNLTTTITSLTLSYTNGSTPVTQSFSGLTIAPSTSQNFSFTTPFNLTGTATLYAYINSVNGISDNTQANDTTSNQFICGSLSGAYTINSGAPASTTNFQSFTSFANTLNCGGVTGPVTINVVSGSGPYNEQITINSILGSSAVNSVTINGNNNTLTFGNGTDYYTLRLNGADYMTWNNLNVISSGTSNGIVLNMMNASDFNTFNNCNFSVSTSITATATSCVAFSSSTTTATGTGNNGNYNTFSNCNMTGGYYCVSVYGNTSANVIGNQFVGCHITEYYVYGLYNVYAGTTIVRDCLFDRPTRTSVSTGYGVYVTTNSTNCLVERNRIRNLFGGAPTSTSTAYALGCVIAASAGNENKFINNVVSDINSAGPLYGLYLSGGNFVQAYHNTISFDQTTSTSTSATYGIYSTGTSGVDIKNNIVSITRGGTGTKYAAYYSTISGVSSNNNDFYVNSPAGVNYVAYDGTTNFATMAAYQTINTTKDQQSVSLNPLYANTSIFNYQPTEALLNNAGTNVGVSVDITGATRGATPDIGAYEFDVAPIDAGVFAFIGPGANGCYGTNESITVSIKNYGANTIDFSVNPLTVICDITGAVTTTLTATPTGTLNSGATMNVVLGPTLNMTTNGTYNMNIYTNLVGDGISSNNALSPAVSRIVGPVGGTIVSSSPAICVSGTPVLTLSGNYGGSIQWKQSTVSATGPWTNVGTGTNSYTPSSAITQTTYYKVEVSCNSNIATSNILTVVVNNPILLGTTPGTRCGIGTVTLGASVSTGNSANWYTSATSGTPIGSGTTFVTPTISSTTTYYVAANSGSGTTQTSSNGVPTVTTSTQNGGLQFTLFQDVVLNSIQVYSTAAGTATVTLEDNANTVMYVSPAIPIIASNLTTPQTLTLGWSIPSGVGYHIKVANTGGALGYASGAFPAPMGNGVGTITNGWLGSTTSTLNYFVYNMNTTTGCEGSRVPVVATVTTPPAITASTADPILCPSASTTVSVTSPNDPNYTYVWTSSPGSFTATGAGPHSVSPTTTTVYTVSAVDNTTGANAGCANVATVTITTAPAITGGTLSTSINSYCVSGSPVLNVTGAAGGVISFQSSNNATGPWTTVSSGIATTYTPSSPITATTYYRVLVSCGSGSATSNVLTITISSPQVLTTIPGSRCGIGTVNLGVTVGAGVTAKWYSAPTGGAALASGTSFTTPTIATTTSYYVEPIEGLGGSDSVAVPLATGGTTGSYHHMFLVTSPTGMTLNAIGIKCNNTAGTLTAWDVYYRPDNYQTVSGSNTSSTGWILLTSATNVVSVGATDYTYISTGNALTIPAGASYSFYIAPASGSTHQYGTTTAGTNVISNANATIISGHRGSALFNCSTSGGIAVVKLKYVLGCSGTRVPVLATINTPPSMTVTAVDPTLCPGGSTSISVSSTNPSYSYTWTSNPTGFTATGVGPHTISPTATTKYYVSAIDNTSGAFAGCANLDSVTVITAATLSAGTITTSQSTLCISGSPTLTNTGTSGGAIQWQSSTVSATGPWNNVGSGATTFTPSSLTQTTYFRVQVSCQSTSVFSNVITVTVNNPQIVSSTPGVVCGTSGSVTISATATSGADIKWYGVPTGGTVLGSGANFNTPTLTSTTTYYAEPSVGGSGGSASPIQVTELDLGTNDQLEIQNVSPDPVDVTGWKVAISDNYTNITAVNANIQTLSGIMAPGATIKWTDATAGPNYWGSNMLWNPGAYPSFTGWAAILDNNNVLKDIVFMNWPAANIAGASITVGSTVITVGSQWSGNGIDITTVAATNSVSRQGTSDNNNASDFAIIPLSLGTTNTGMTIPFTGFGCVGSRVPVVVNVGPCNSTLNLSLFIQGYYDGGVGAMLPVLANQFEPTTPNACDSIDVELRDATTYGVVQSLRTILNQNGTATCVFPPVSGSYYVAVKHRNGLQTWSANPISFATSPVSYNFTNAANKAYGDNQIEVASGVWAFYSGDIIIDENLDLLDISAVEADINNFASGYLSTDINGDGNVDLLDSPPVETNINNFVFSLHP